MSIYLLQNRNKTRKNAILISKLLVPSSFCFEYYNYIKILNINVKRFNFKTLTFPFRLT